LVWSSPSPSKAEGRGVLDETPIIDVCPAVLATDDPGACVLAEVALHSKADSILPIFSWAYATAVLLEYLLDAVTRSDCHGAYRIWSPRIFACNSRPVTQTTSFASSQWARANADIGLTLGEGVGLGRALIYRHNRCVPYSTDESGPTLIMGGLLYLRVIACCGR
jgi:hypothetical protein